MEMRIIENRQGKPYSFGGIMNLAVALLQVFFARCFSCTKPAPKVWKPYGKPKPTPEEEVCGWLADMREQIDYTGG